MNLRDVAARDLDGDDRLYVVAAGHDAHDVTVVLGNDTGTLHPGGVTPDVPARMLTASPPSVSCTLPPSRRRTPA
jgi:hypothetical protein